MREDVAHGERTLYRNLVRRNQSPGLSAALYGLAVAEYRREMARICEIRREIRKRIEQLPSYSLMGELVDVFCRVRENDADTLWREAHEDMPEMACDIDFVLRERVADAICDTLSYEGKSPEKFLVNTLLKEALA